MCLEEALLPLARRAGFASVDDWLDHGARYGLVPTAEHQESSSRGTPESGEGDAP